MIATVTIQGLYRFNNHLFDGLSVPDGVDKSETIGAILRTVADLPALYADPVFLQEYISNWAYTRLYTWERVQDALSAEYSPIDNYNMEESEEEGIEILRDNSGENNEYIQGFETSKGLTNSGKTAGSNSETVDNAREKTKTIHGNTGLAKQKLIEQEMNLRNEWNIYDYIANDFKKEFCLQIY